MSFPRPEEIKMPVNNGEAAANAVLETIACHLREGKFSHGAQTGISVVGLPGTVTVELELDKDTWLRASRFRLAAEISKAGWIMNLIAEAPYPPPGTAHDKVSVRITLTPSTRPPANFVRYGRHFLEARPAAPHPA